MLIKQNFSLKQFNTFHVSAKARYFAEINTVEDLTQCLAFVKKEQVPYMIIGQGSNLLFQQDFPGLIMELNMHGISVVDESADGVLIQAACGESWHDFVMYCLGKGYYGLENLSLIPGTVGAAPVQNIGAYGVEVAKHFHSLEAMEISSGEIKTFDREACQFDYRQSVFKQGLKDQYIILNVTFTLHKNADVTVDYPALKKALEKIPADKITPELVSEKVIAIRNSKLPDPVDIGNAGSFFWNPVISEGEYVRLAHLFPGIPGFSDDNGKVKVPAAWLIDQAGWKGFREGDVGVHKEHALVLVNYGNATGAELVDLSARIQKSVKQQFGIELYPEVRII